MGGRREGEPPGILTLLELIEQHQGAFEFDWRTRFGLPLSSIPRGMGFGEAWRLTTVLARDPSSWVAAALAGWKYPLGREGLAALDLYDLQHASKSARKAKPYPRPWDREPTRYVGKPVSIEQWRAMRPQQSKGGD